MSALATDPLAAAAAFGGLFVLAIAFSGTETALFSLQALDRQRFSADPVGRRVLALLGRRVAVITSMLLGHAAIVVSMALIASALLAARGAPWWAAIAVLVPLLLLVAEMPARTVALHYNASWARAAAWPLTAWVALVAPARLVLGGAVAALSALFGVRYGQSEERLEESEILALLERGTAGGGVDPREREIARAVFDFDDIEVGRLMTPLPDMFSVPVDIPWDDLLARCREDGHSRVPVYEGSTDNVIGVLLLKDLLKFRRHPPAGPRQFRSMLLPPVFVPRSKTADKMLRQFLERRFHMAFVVNEHGTLVGLVTLDDLLSELVGEILDSDDEAVRTLERPGPGVIEVKGAMDLEDFEEETGIVLPDGEYETVGGFVFHQLERLPVVGDEVRWEAHRFVVTAMDGRRIQDLRIEAVAPEEPT